MRAAGVGPHTRRVARRVTSPALIGRANELKAAHDAASSAKAGRARIVLLAGDAGIGKTRLIGELCARARQGGMLAAVGGCIQLGEASLAYAPLVQVLRELRRQLGAETFGALLGPGAAPVGVLLGDARAAPSDVGAGALFEHLLAFFGRLGAHQPALLVFEDMHWADPSTRDLVAFLGRNLREAAVTLMLTYRSDELHRRHPYGPCSPISNATRRSSGSSYPASPGPSSSPCSARSPMSRRRPRTSTTSSRERRATRSMSRS